MLEYKSLKEPQQNSWLLLTCFSVWSFIILCRPQDYITFLGYIRPGMTLGIITLILWVLFSNKNIEYIADNQIRLYKYMIIVLVMSVPFSYYPGASLNDLFIYCPVILFVFLFNKLVNTISQMRNMLFVYCIGIGMYGIAILINGSIAEGRISFGTMFDPNDLAFYVLSFICLNFIFTTANNKTYIRTISTINIITGLLIIIKTGSRGGLIALLTVIAYLLFTKSYVLRTTFITKCAVLIVAILSLQFIDINERYKTILDVQDDYNSKGEEGRIAIWKSGMKQMLTHPFTGVGFNRFPEGIGRDRDIRGLDSAKWQTAHNSLIQIGTETGVLGFILFGVLSYNAFTIFARIAKKSKNEELAKIGAIAKVGFIGHFISAMFLSQAYSVYWAFYIVFSAILRRFDEAEGTSK